MIKGCSFGRLLKQLFSILLISCFILLGNYSSSYTMEYGFTVLNNNILSTPNWDGNMEFEVIEDGYLYSQDKQTQIGANLLTFAAGNNNRFYFFFSNYRPYFYYYYNGISQAIQGFTENYYECVGDLTTSTDLQLCTKKEYNHDDLGYFFSTITNNDKWAYNVNGGWITNSIDGQPDCFFSSIFVMYVCFYSSELNKSECFAYSDNPSNAIGTSCEVVGDPLVDSLHISNNKNYTDLGNYISTPPYYINLSGGVFTGGTLDGSSSGNFVDSYTGDYVYSTCTNGDIINYLESQGMSKYLCYGGLDNWDSYNSSLSYTPTPGTGFTIGQITSHDNVWGGYGDWFNFWNGIYQDRNNSTFNSMWESYPAVYRTWFDLYYQYGGDVYLLDSVYEYCLMTTNFSLDLNSVYKGIYFKRICSDVQNFKKSSSSSGENVVGLNFGSGQKTYTDGTVFITDFFNLLKSNLVVGYGDSFGYLPTYIIMFFLALILFRFISH